MREQSHLKAIARALEGLRPEAAMFTLAHAMIALGQHLGYDKSVVMGAFSAQWDITAEAARAAKDRDHVPMGSGS